MWYQIFPVQESRREREAEFSSPPRAISNSSLYTDKIVKSESSFPTSNPDFKSIFTDSRNKISLSLSLSLKFMAQFTVQGRLKPLFNGDGKSMAFEPKDHRRRRKLVGDSAPFPHRFRDRKLGLFASSTRKSDLFNAEASLTVGNDGVYDDSDDEFERDELSCFRGLVLDISYRSLFSAASFNIVIITSTQGGGT